MHLSMYVQSVIFFSYSPDIRHFSQIGILHGLLSHRSLQHEVVTDAAAAALTRAALVQLCGKTAEHVTVFRQHVERETMERKCLFSHPKKSISQITI